MIKNNDMYYLSLNIKYMYDIIFFILSCICLIISVLCINFIEILDVCKLITFEEIIFKTYAPAKLCACVVHAYVYIYTCSHVYMRKISLQVALKIRR